ncbi:hypothetical protein WN51_14646 [Melipona quadrifasciata]|uniref:Uncharacterized protein n=1 Tax=Melipona quadrifasciata TaxID=166423 RepID=A0A0M9A076_9HYME|nr:hypothetical protein WN51_14646 [Melipona quadrifasciata]
MKLKLNLNFSAKENLYLKDTGSLDRNFVSIFFVKFKHGFKFSSENSNLATQAQVFEFKFKLKLQQSPKSELQVWGEASPARTVNKIRSSTPFNLHSVTDGLTQTLFYARVRYLSNLPEVDLRCGSSFLGMIEGSFEHPQMSSISIIDLLFFILAVRGMFQVTPIDITISMDPSLVRSTGRIELPFA